MLKQDFDEVINMIDSEYLKSFANVAKGLGKIHQLFNHINQEFLFGQDEGKEEMIKMLLKAQSKLQEKLEGYYRESGMNEEQVKKAAENTASLPEECQTVLALVKHELSETAKNFQEYMKKKGPVQITDKPEEKKAKKSRKEWKKS